MIKSFIATRFPSASREYILFPRSRFKFALNFCSLCRNSRECVFINMYSSLCSPPPLHLLCMRMCVNINIFVSRWLSPSHRPLACPLARCLSLTHSHSPNLSLSFSLSLSLPRLSARVVKKRVLASLHSHP